jgi:membrane-bound lytic murein transglycosylase D
MLPTLSLAESRTGPDTARPYETAPPLPAEAALAPDPALAPRTALALAPEALTPPPLPDHLPPLTAPLTPATEGAITTLSADISPVLTTDHTLEQRDLWQRIRDGYKINGSDSPLTAKHEKWYASRPDYLARMVERSQRYLHFIVDEVEKRGMPTEIALLPMIESAFNPSAYSTGHASGIWQFIPSTGKNFGLQQNWWYDGRRDIISATQGALDYLQKLHQQFGNWELALAAYNWGEGAVFRAQEKNRRKGLPTDYASLDMPSETRNYVPKLLAIKNIVGDPKKFGVTLQPLLNGPYFAAVTTSRHIDVKLAAQLADISMDEFNALNPAHNRPVILEEHATTLLLPVDKAATFRTNLENYSQSLVSWQAYKSRKGERLDKVAPRFGMTLDKLKSINGLSQRTRLSTGQALLVRLNGNTEGEFSAFNTHYMPASRPAGRKVTHIVKKGETLSSVSRRYRVQLAKLQDWNNGVSGIYPGQRLTIIKASVKSSKTARGKARGKNRVRLASASKNKKNWARKAAFKPAPAKKSKRSAAPL